MGGMGEVVVGAGDKSLGGGGRVEGRKGGRVDNAPGASGVQHQENEVTVCRLLWAPGSRIMTCPDSWLPSTQQLGDKPHQQPRQQPDQQPHPKPHQHN